MTQWQKIQCQKLNIPVFDPQEDTRMFTYNYSQYVTNEQVAVETMNLDWYDRTKLEIGTANARYKSGVPGWVFQSKYLADTQHTTPEGNLVLSFFYENWMKTVLMAN